MQFDLAQQTAAGDLVALNVRLQQRAARPETLRLLGCVVTLKDGFGFVRWAGRLMFIHTHDLTGLSNSLLAAGPPMLQFCLLTDTCYDVLTGIRCWVDAAHGLRQPAWSVESQPSGPFIRDALEHHADDWTKKIKVTTLWGLPAVLCRLAGRCYCH